MTLHRVALAGITAVVAVSVLAGCSALSEVESACSVPMSVPSSSAASTVPVPVPAAVPAAG